VSQRCGVVDAGGTGGWAGVLKGWLLMAIAVLLVAAPAYGIGYLIAKNWGTT